MDVIYNINNPRALNLGQQYDHNARTVTFTGFTPVDNSNTIYLKFEGLGLYPLCNMAFQVTQAFTLKDGTFQGQLLELASDGSLVQNSNTFKMMVKPSVDEEEEIVQNDSTISLWFNDMTDLYNDVLGVYENGLAVTSESIAEALGYTPADAASVPSAVSELTNDSGYITTVTQEDVASALGYTPVSPEDIGQYITGITSQDISDALGYTPADASSVPTLVSDLTNDAGYINGIASSDVTSALGYTPVNPADMSQYITDITSEDVTSALGYTPADALDIPTVPDVISAFENDSGYITGITSSDVIDALGYTPFNSDYGNFQTIKSITLNSASSDIVISTDSNGDTFSLDGVVVIIRNASGIGGSSNGYMYAYDADDQIIGGGSVFYYGGNSSHQAVVEFEKRGAIVEMKSTGWSTASPYSPSNRSLIRQAANTGRIAKIEISGNGLNLNANTTINVLGYSIVADDGESDYIVSDSNFELLKTITLSSASDDVVITATDSNHNAVELLGFVVMLYNANGIGGSTNSYVYAYDSDDNIVGGSQIFFASGSSITDAAVKCELRGGLAELYSVGWNERTSYSPIVKSFTNESGNIEDIVKVEILGNGYSLSSGTTIKLYGVIK